jgi:hypothetical protein
VCAADAALPVEIGESTDLPRRAGGLFEFPVAIEQL